MASIHEKDQTLPQKGTGVNTLKDKLTINNLLCYRH